MVFTNPTSYSALPEIQALKKKVRMRFLALCIPWVVVLLTILNRVKLISFDYSGAFGTALLLVSLISITYLVMDKGTFLPFLGEAVLPPSTIVQKTPTDAAFTITVNVPSHATHVMYWASESGNGVAPDPFEAYGNYTNAGVVKVSSDGSATLLVRCPQQYIVRGRSLPRHVHYRAVYKSGIVGPVRTAPITCA